MAGKQTKKKDLASMLMTYKDVYVAQVSMGANPDQCVQAFVEAENYNGPSVIIAYAPCVNHGYNLRESRNHETHAMRSGYTTLFRYNPENKEPMKVDSFEPIENYEDYVETENRFSILKKVNPSNKNKLIKQSKQDALNRRKEYLNKQKN
jgi:pyruvate-ferredoxin/flavodoxin oxidoreductase